MGDEGYAAAMRRHLGPLLVMAIALIAAACSPKRPTVVPQAVRIWGAEVTGVIVRTELDVYNPNRFNLNVAAVSGTIVLANQVPLGSASVPTSSHLPRRGWQHVTADMRLPWLNLPAVLALAGTRAMVPYTFDGNASIGSKLRVTIPFRIQGEVPAAELMRAGMPFPFGARSDRGSAPLQLLATTAPLAAVTELWQRDAGARSLTVE